MGTTRERPIPDADGMIECEPCGGSGRESRGHANSPDRRTVGPCGTCDGHGMVMAPRRD